MPSFHVHDCRINLDNQRPRKVKLFGFLQLSVVETASKLYYAGAINCENEENSGQYLTVLQPVTYDSYSQNLVTSTIPEKITPHPLSVKPKLSDSERGKDFTFYFQKQCAQKL